MDCAFLQTPSYSTHDSQFQFKHRFSPNFSRKRKCEDEDYSKYGFCKISRIHVLPDDIKVADYQWTFDVGNECTNTFSFYVVEDVLIISCDLNPRPGFIGAHSVRRRIPLSTEIDPSSVRVCFDSMGHLLIGAWKKKIF